MTREEIILMAREAGINVAENNSFADNVYIFVLYRFAALVAAAEREACAALVETLLGENPDLSEVYIAAEIRERGQE